MSLAGRHRVAHTQLGTGLMAVVAALGKDVSRIVGSDRLWASSLTLA